MTDEIFAPILPMVTYKSFSDAIEFIRKREKPLAFYIFTRDNQRVEQAHSALSFGGGCVNDVVVHLTNPNMPFGGVGNSGLGSYHSGRGLKPSPTERAYSERVCFLTFRCAMHPTNPNSRTVSYGS